MRPHLAQDFKGRVLVGRYDDFSQESRLLAHRYLQTRHRPGFNIESLGVITYGGEDQLRFHAHVHPQRIIALFVRRGAYLRAPKMNIHIRDSLARHFIDYLTDNNRLHRQYRQGEHQQ